MIKIGGDEIIYFDVDGTLVLYSDDLIGLKYKRLNMKHGIRIPLPGETTRYGKQKYMRLIPHEGHIKLLKQRKEEGWTIVVWSLGGVNWAESVVKTLNLEEYVDLVITKPIEYVDDFKCEDFMFSRIYEDPKKLFDK